MVSALEKRRRKIMKGFIVAVAFAALAVAACNKGDSSGAAGSGSAASGGGGTGIAECDQWISKMQDCLGKMDPTAKAAAQPAFDATKSSWTQAAKDPNGKAALQASCKQMLDGFASQNPQCK
jgi:hypothetical protein